MPCRTASSATRSSFSTRACWPRSRISEPVDRAGRVGALSAAGAGPLLARGRSPMQRACRRRPDALVPVVPPNSVAGRRARSKDLLDDAVARWALGGLRLRDNSVSSLQFHLAPPIGGPPD